MDLQLSTQLRVAEMICGGNKKGMSPIAESMELMMIGWTERERFRPSDIDSYGLKSLFHWLKSKNRQYMSENYVIFTKTEWRVSLASFQDKFQAQGQGRGRDQGHDQG